jgi:hypothetical protein
MTEELRFVMLGENQEEIRTLKDMATEAGLSAPASQKGGGLELDPLTATVLVGGALLTGRFLLSVVDRFRGGLRVDLRTVPPTVERLKDLPYGLVVVLTADFDVRIKTVEESRDSVARMLTEVLKLPATATAEVVAGVYLDHIAPR